MRLIDADALMEDLSKWLKQVDPTHPPEDNALPPMEDIIVSTLMTIESQPTIEAVPVVHGRWMRYGEDGYPNETDTTIWQCDQCLETYYGRTTRIPNYCPNCGANMKMDGGEDDPEES